MGADPPLSSSVAGPVNVNGRMFDVHAPAGYTLAFSATGIRMAPDGDRLTPAPGEATVKVTVVRKVTGVGQSSVDWLQSSSPDPLSVTPVAGVELGDGLGEVLAAVEPDGLGEVLAAVEPDGLGVRDWFDDAAEVGPGEDPQAATNVTAASAVHFLIRISSPCPRERLSRIS
ncbi:MAG: hypothetical protein ACYCXA_07990 [Actinomycetes bacterium]